MLTYRKFNDTFIDGTPENHYEITLEHSVFGREFAITAHVQKVEGSSYEYIGEYEVLFLSAEGLNGGVIDIERVDHQKHIVYIK